MNSTDMSENLKKYFVLKRDELYVQSKYEEADRIMDMYAEIEKVLDIDSFETELERQYDQGCQDGYDDAYQEGYEQGHDVGYEEGQCDCE